MSRFTRCFPAALAAFVAIGAVDPAEPISFRGDVAPILVGHCLGCHNDEKTEGGLNMATFAQLMAGGEVLPGESIVPGSPESSYLIELIQPDAAPRMPDRQPPLPASTIAVLERWVREGARFDGPSETQTRLAVLVDPLVGLPDVATLVPTAEPVAALAFSPDGSLVAAGRGSDLFVVATDGGALKATLSGHQGRITSVLWTPDGTRLIVSGGRPGMFGAIAVSDLSSGDRLLDLRGHRDSILAATLSRDGLTLATASYDGSIALWNAQSGEQLRTLKEHTDAVHAVEFSPDGQKLASASGDRTIKLWDVATGTRRHTVSDATAEQYTLVFRADGSTLLAAGVDRVIRSWRILGESVALENQAIAHEGAVLRLAIDPANSLLLSSGEDRRIMVWDLATLTPRSTYPEQSDWPISMSVSPDSSLLAVGRYDGSLALLATEGGRELSALLKAPGPETTRAADVEEAPKPELVRDATLGPPSPKGAARGQTIRVALSGRGVHETREVAFPEPGIIAKIVESDELTPDQLTVDLWIAEDARPGLHRFGVRTAMGTPPFQTFEVSAYPETPVTQARTPDAAPFVAFPTTIHGRIDSPGAFDHIRFHAREKQVVVANTLAQGFGSRLSPILAVLDKEGRILVDSRGTGRDPDPTLTFIVPEEGTYTFRIGDALLSGSAGHEYRITLGELPRVRSVTPLGVEAGHVHELTFQGENLGERTSTRLDVPRDAEPGSLLHVSPPSGVQPASSLTTGTAVVSQGPQVIESEENDDIASAQSLATPGGVTGRIDQPGDVDLFRFEAQKGRSLIIEVYGQRLGSEIDPVIEILDDSGNPVPRAVLKPVATTNVAFRNHGAKSRTIRLTTWSDLRVGDYLLAGRELMRLTELPRNPDDDAVFWGLGVHRTNMGERVSFLETTPEHHPQNQLMRKVEIHPPGTTFPPGGAPPIALYYRNDDAGPGFGGDSRLTFDPSSEGSYHVRLEDARGGGGRITAITWSFAIPDRTSR